MDNPTKTGVLEPDNININEDKELNYWTEKFDITKVKLKAAINAAGPAVKEVEAYLRKK